MKAKNYSFKPLTKETWDDLVALFGPRGACGGCWCMAWRIKSSEFEKLKGDGNRKALKKLADKGKHLGILAYDNNEPVGWCAFAPREDYIRLENSRVLARVDDKPVWSVTCFYIHKNYRRSGLSVMLLENAVKFCKQNGVKILEGYPVTPYTNNMPAAFAWTGLPGTFEQAGFDEAAVRNKRKIMRKKIK